MGIGSLRADGLRCRRDKIGALNMPNWITHGSHRYYLDEDLIFFELHGLFEIEDMQKLRHESQRIAKEQGYVLSVFDANDGLNMSPAARRHASDIARQFPVDGASLVIGANLAMRTVAQLLQNAARLLGRTLPPIDFCARLEEVPKWLEQQRLRLRALHPGSRDRSDKRP
jgi:hypothetical protein